MGFFFFLCFDLYSSLPSPPPRTQTHIHSRKPQYTLHIAPGYTRFSIYLVGNLPETLCFHAAFLDISRFSLCLFKSHCAAVPAQFPNIICFPEYSCPGMNASGLSAAIPALQAARGSLSPPPHSSVVSGSTCRQRGTGSTQLPPARQLRSLLRGVTTTGTHTGRGAAVLPLCPPGLDPQPSGVCFDGRVTPRSNRGTVTRCTVMHPLYL